MAIFIGMALAVRKSSQIGAHNQKEIRKSFTRDERRSYPIGSQSYYNRSMKVRYLTSLPPIRKGKLWQKCHQQTMTVALFS